MRIKPLALTILIPIFALVWLSSITTPVYAQTTPNYEDLTLGDGMELTAWYGAGAYMFTCNAGTATCTIPSTPPISGKVWGGFSTVATSTVPAEYWAGFAYYISLSASDDVDVYHNTGFGEAGGASGVPYSTWVCLIETGYTAPAYCDVYLTYYHDHAADMERIYTGWQVSDQPGSAVYSNFRLLYDPAYTPPEDPPEDPEPVSGIGYSCVVSYTETITDAEGITTTQNITYTVPDANLVKNPSFENLNQIGTDYYPQDWGVVIDGAIDYSIGDIVSSSSNSGDYAVYSRGQYELWGDLLRTLPPGDYKAGYSVGCSNLSCNYDLLSLSIDTQEITETHVYSISAGSYTNYSGTISLGGGSPNVIIDFRAGGAPYTLVDDVWMYPVDASGNISCTAALYPEDEYYTDPIGAVPGPIGAAGAVCYRCTTPTSLAAATVSYWLAWLGCVLRNMFSCSLRVWLLVIGNWISGLINQGTAWIAWIPMTMAQGAGWLAVTLSGFSTSVINSGTNLFDLLIAVIELLGTLISVISDIVLSLVGLLVSFLSLIPDALQAPAIGFTLNGTDYTGFAPGDMGDGPSEAKIVWLFLSGIGYVDTQVFTNEYVNTAIFVMLGAASLLALMWAVKQWSEALRF